MSMSLTLPTLPYSLDALEPHVSRRTLATHHGRHHAAYVEKTRSLVQRTNLEGASLEQMDRQSRIKSSRSAVARTYRLAAARPRAGSDRCEYGPASAARSS